MEKTTITLAEVAAAAGVGESTVSRVLRNKGSFSGQSRERVLAAAEALGYMPNRIAGSLASSGSQLAAVIVPSLSNIVFSDILGGAGEVFDSAGFTGVFGVSEYEPDKEEQLIASFLQYRPAAVLLAGLEHTERAVRMLAAANCRVVEMLDFDEGGLDIVVGFSNQDAGRASARHLIDRGYRTIGYAGHNLDMDKRAAKRLRGFREELARVDLGLADTMITSERSSVGLGKRVLAGLLDRTPGLEAIYFSNDDMAIGGYFHCLGANISVPEKLGLAGHNGLEIGSLLPKPLSTVRTPRVEIGRMAATLALTGAAAQRVCMPFELIQGATTRKPTT